MVGIILKNGDHYYPDEDFVKGLRELYSGVDFEGEFRKMAAWCLSNPERRKTKRGMTRFINSWMTKAYENRPRPQGIKPCKAAYTIDTLNRAYNVLNNFGREKFEVFCKGVNMSEYDRECVLNSYEHDFPYKIKRLANVAVKGV